MFLHPIVRERPNLNKEMRHSHIDWNLNMSQVSLFLRHLDERSQNFTNNLTTYNYIRTT